MVDKLCFGCKHFYWRNATGGCDTCSSPFGMSCDKNVWQFDEYETSILEFQDSINKAKTCEHFKLRSELQ